MKRIAGFFDLCNQREDNSIAAEIVLIEARHSRDWRRIARHSCVAQEQE